MSFLEKFSQKAEKFARTTARKSKLLAQIAKLNMNISSEEEQIRKAYVELGRLYYEDYKNVGLHEGDKYADCCVKIDNSKEIISGLQQKIVDLKEAEKESEETIIIIETVEKSKSEDENPTTTTMYIDIEEKE